MGGEDFRVHVSLERLENEPSGARHGDALDHLVVLK